ncbi:MAG: multidrug efflux SMR transporter [Alphaproteobacteria bacterium]
MGAYAYLALAIAAEITGTTALKLSDGMTRFGPAATVVAGYGIAFWLMSLSLKVLPLGLVYAIWSAIGIAGTTVIGILLFSDPWNVRTLFGATLTIAGIAVMLLGQPAQTP